MFLNYTPDDDDVFMMFGIDMTYLSVDPNMSLPTRYSPILGYSRDGFSGMVSIDLTLFIDMSRDYYAVRDWLLLCIH